MVVSVVIAFCLCRHWVQFQVRGSTVVISSLCSDGLCKAQGEPSFTNNDSEQPGVSTIIQLAE